MDDKELIKLARVCAALSGSCKGCPLEDDTRCETKLLNALADRLEELHGE